MIDRTMSKRRIPQPQWTEQAEMEKNNSLRRWGVRGLADYAAERSQNAPAQVNTFEVRFLKFAEAVCANCPLHTHCYIFRLAARLAIPTETRLFVLAAFVSLRCCLCRSGRCVCLSLLV